MDTDLFRELLRNANWLWALLSLALGFAMMAVSCWKWRVLMGDLRSKVTFAEMLKVYAIGYYFSNLLPTNIGGDVARSYLLGEKVGSQSRSAVGVFLERGSGVLFLLLLVILAPLARPELYSHPALWIPAMLSAMLLLGLVLLVAFRKPIQKLESIVPGLVRRTVPFASFRAKLVVLWDGLFSQLRSFYRQLSAALLLLRSNPSEILAVAATTATFYGMTWMHAYFAFRVFGIAPAWVDVIAVTPAAMLVSTLPIAPFGSLGIMEASMTGYFSLVGIAPASGTAMGLFLRFQVVLTGLVGFFLFLGHKHAAQPTDGRGGKP
jgi:uncharacterized protein (TIRG00374 family)